MTEKKINKCNSLFLSREGDGLYHSDFEKSSCGIGFVANLKGVKKHSIITNALGMLGCMEHREAVRVLISRVVMERVYFYKYHMSCLFRNVQNRILNYLLWRVWGWYDLFPN